MRHNVLHAVLWPGADATPVDLTPSGSPYSEVHGISSGLQAGWASIPTSSGYAGHALVWSGSAKSVVDLHQFLPAGLTQSYANGIDASGNIEGYATDSAVVNHPILWKPLP